MKNIALLIFVIFCVSCSQVTPVDNEIDFQKSLFSKFGYPDKVDTTYLNISSSKIRSITYFYKKDSPQEDILYQFHSYIDKIFNNKAYSISDNIPARYDANWTDYDSDFEVHLQGGRQRKTVTYSVYVQTRSYVK